MAACESSHLMDVTEHVHQKKRTGWLFWETTKKQLYGGKSRPSGPQIVYYISYDTLHVEVV